MQNIPNACPKSQWPALGWQSLAPSAHFQLLPNSGLPVHLRETATGSGWFRRSLPIHCAEQACIQSFAEGDSKSLMICRQQLCKFKHHEIFDDCFQWHHKFCFSSSAHAQLRKAKRFSGGKISRLASSSRQKSATSEADTRFCVWQSKVKSGFRNTLPVLTPDSLSINYGENQLASLALLDEWVSE